ncbi:MAG: M14 family zinc carboxypeptidase, partial [Candidatus Aminicenantes bacterium]|nr:M14 family zinc carboxypeptidase [Candidatus Aminicenantes bacterium]
MRQNAKFLRTLQKISLVLVILVLITQIGQAQRKVTSPEEFFGFQLGSDRRIARWDKIVDYFKLLQEESSKIKVIDMGPSTMGNPFLVIIISSLENLANLDHLQEVNAKISDPRGIAEAEIKELVKEGKAVICQSMSLHATEIGGTQMAPELTYDLLSREDEETQRILDNVLFFLIPSFNPDGQIMVTDWYNKTLGTEYEGASLPWLYHKYVGHDNNRDGDFLNMIESVYAAKIMYRDWIPQAYIDHHHMGSYGARFYIPPYCEPIRPYADPLIWREHSWYGAHIAYKLEENGKAGILNAAQYPGWGHFGWHWITPFHNIAGMLTESASAQLATPIYIHPEQLRGDSRQFPEYEAQTTFPNPWPGGWWRLRDIVEQKKIS